MQIKFLDEIDVVNYKKVSMFIGFPKCTFKCNKEYGKKICHNLLLTKEPNIEIFNEELIWRYTHNPLSEAIVCGGLEPFESSNDLINLINAVRAKCKDDIVIYTGYTEEELNHFKDIKGEVFKQIIKLPNIIIKFGRYIPNHVPHYDKILGVNLASDNQYAKQYNVEEK